MEGFGYKQGLTSIIGSGLVVGKFYPPHLGHSYLIETAIHGSDFVTVIVCEREGETISARQRARWIKENHPEVFTLILDDIYPEDDSELWARITIEFLGYVPETVYTSEDYGEPYAYYMGCKHVLVDRQRVHVPISATLVRSNPEKYLKFLKPNVRRYYAQDMYHGC